MNREVARLVGDLTGVPPVNVRRMATGASSLNLLARQAAEAYVVRLEMFRSLKDVVEDIAVARRCGDAGVSTYDEPIFVGLWQGIPTVVRRYVEGRTLNSLRAIPLDAAARAARALGLIHATSSPTERVWFYEAATSAPELIRAPTSGLAGSARGHVMRLSERVWPLLAQHRSLVHTDFKGDNLVLTANGLVVLDWEKATVGSQLFDLGLAQFHLIARQDWNDSRRAARAFLTSYFEINPLKEQVMLDLPRLVVYSASVYFLIDAEIYARTSASQSRLPADRRHAAYYRRYCTPTYGRLLNRIDLLADAITLG